jgi:tRNA A-37 threonylcarbamoyl transferase component Bud32
VALARQVDLLCDEFERRWRQGERPRIDDFLQRGLTGPLAPPPELLSEELLAVELECRCRLGETPRPDEYTSRLAVSAAGVERLLAEGQIDSEPDRMPEGARAPGSPDTAAAPLAETGDWRPFPVDGSPPALPCVFGEYELLEKLGQGGMGAVYKARHRRLDKQVAVKLVRPDVRNSSRFLARFQREMQAIGRLEHPHLVEAQHAGEHEGVLFLAMKLVEGVDLARLVRAQGPLPVADACELARQAALGLHHVHQCGLVHRDVKPSNLMLTSEGQVKILDLGIARLAGEGVENAALTQERTTLGTIDYMAPEQALDAAAVDGRADVYSLGCTLFHLLTSKPPYADQPRAKDKLRAHLQGAVPSPRSLRADLPPELARLVERMLAKHPEDRPATAQEVARALEPLAAGADLVALALAGGVRVAKGARASTTVPATARRTDRLPPAAGRRRTVLVTALAGVLAVAVLVGVGQRFWPRPSGGSTAPPPAPDVAEKEGEAKGVPVAAAGLTIRSLRVSHFAVVDGRAVPRDDLGVKSFATRFGDQVRVSAELSEPAFAYLLAFNADGTEQLLVPSDPRAAPPRRNGMEYPEAAGDAFNLDDGVGLQAFVVVASKQPLPAYTAWKKDLPTLPWKTLPVREAVVWRCDGRRLDAVLPGGRVERGTVGQLAGVGPLAELCRQLRSTPGVEALAAVAFPVLPRLGQ